MAVKQEEVDYPHHYSTPRKKKKLICGVGINDCDYRTTIRVNNKVVWTCPYFRVWQTMVRRCYSENFLTRNPTYRGCSVCDEWLYFSKFRAWMVEQEWDDKHMDKDLLFYRNKVYSPETVVFTSRQVNSFLTTTGARRGDYPIGVNKLKTRYVSRCGDGYKGRYQLGSYGCPMEAHRQWQLKKIEVARMLKGFEENSHPKVQKGLQRVIDKIQNDYDNNLETIDF